MNSASSRRDEGFTLIEVLVALVILTLSFAAVMGLLSSGMMSVERAEDQRLAILVAQSTLDRVEAERPLQSGQRAGPMEDRFRWRVLIEPYREIGLDPKLAVRPYQLTVTVTWGAMDHERSIRLIGLHIDSPESRE
jgi:general secretion pathway protein I